MRKGQRFARAFKRAVAVEYLQSGDERKVIALFNNVWHKEELGDNK